MSALTLVSAMLCCIVVLHCCECTLVVHSCCECECECECTLLLCVHSLLHATSMLCYAMLPGLGIPGHGYRGIHCIPGYTGLGCRALGARRPGHTTAPYTARPVAPGSGARAVGSSMVRVLIATGSLLVVATMPRSMPCAEPCEIVRSPGPSATHCGQLTL